VCLIVWWSTDKGLPIESVYTVCKSDKPLIQDLNLSLANLWSIVALYLIASPKRNPVDNNQ